MAKQSASAPPRYHVLVLSADPDARDALRTVLEHGHCHVTACADGRAARHAALMAGRSYDALVLDVPNLGPDGLGVMERLRATPGGAHAPLICVSTGPRGPVPEARWGGLVARYVTAPLADRELVQAIEELAGDRPVRSAS
jgi:CheY-like chemotaxis protein